MPTPVPENLTEQVREALAEDVGDGDLTAALIPDERWGRASIITRDTAILCGVPYAEATFRLLDPLVEIEWLAREGDRLEANQTLCTLHGPARALLTGERTALNFLQLLSATAAAAHAFSLQVADTGCSVLDTRKTLPGLRLAQKYAVRVGGGTNHRIGLFDMVLVKENHIVAAGSIAQAVAAARKLKHDVRIEVEVETIDELRQAIAAGADIAMLDEFTLNGLREAVAVNRGAVNPLKLEASGSVTLESVRAIALTGVDYVSVGGLTKHVRAVDLSMRFESFTSRSPP